MRRMMTMTIRGNRLVIPLRDPHNDTHCGQAFDMGSQHYYKDTVDRLELSIEECAAIVSHLPVIIKFMIDELPKETKEVKK
jgi:hypothetical protein